MPGEKKDPQMIPQTAEEHRRALGRLVRLTAHAVADLCELLAELNGHTTIPAEQTRLIEHASQIRSEIREVCRPVSALPVAPGAIVEQSDESPTAVEEVGQTRQSTLRDAPTKPANEARNRSPVRATTPADYVGDFPKELFKK